MRNKLTFIFCMIVFVAIVAFDFWTLVARGFDSTISANFYWLAKDYPIIGFSLGIVCGHLFWPNKAAAVTEAKVLPLVRKE